MRAVLLVNAALLLLLILPTSLVAQSVTPAPQSAQQHPAPNNDNWIQLW